MRTLQRYYYIISPDVASLRFIFCCINIFVELYFVVFIFVENHNINILTYYTYKIIKVYKAVLIQ